jgi:bacterioferritin (cytochrome b1)
MSIPEPDSEHEVILYLDNARQMLEVAAHNLADGFYGSAEEDLHHAQSFVERIAQFLQQEDWL